VATYLGETTNNVAESCSLILALQEAALLGARQVTVSSDSELLTRQVNGAYRVREPQLKLLHVLIKHLIQGFDRFEIRHVPRVENRAADRLANRAVKEGLKQPTFW
jgi:ribonuclease HI